MRARRSKDEHPPIAVPPRQVASKQLADRVQVVRHRRPNAWTPPQSSTTRLEPSTRKATDHSPQSSPPRLGTSRRGEAVTAIIAPAAGDVQGRRSGTTPPIIAPAAGDVQARRRITTPQSSPRGWGRPGEGDGSRRPNHRPSRLWEEDVTRQQVFHPARRGCRLVPRSGPSQQSFGSPYEGTLLTPQSTEAADAEA
jgi:hypothetical protein